MAAAAETLIDSKDHGSGSVKIRVGICAGPVLPVRLNQGARCTRVDLSYLIDNRQQHKSHLADFSSGGKRNEQPWLTVGMVTMLLWQVTASVIGTTHLKYTLLGLARIATFCKFLKASLYLGTLSIAQAVQWILVLILNAVYQAPAAPGSNCNPLKVFTCLHYPK